MLYELILINEIEQRAKIIFLSACLSQKFTSNIAYQHDNDEFVSKCK